MNVQKTLDRLRELEQEQYQIEKILSHRAGEWYRIESGRTHFHPLEFRYQKNDGSLRFVTPVRGGDIDVDIPLSWFEEVSDEHMV